MFESSIPLFLIAAWLLAITLIAPYVLLQTKKKKAINKTVKDKLNIINKFIDVYESRLQIVRSHAIDYLNSLGSEGARIMSEIQTEVAKLKLLKDEVENIVDSKSYKSLKKAEDILKGKTYITIDSNYSELVKSRDLQEQKYSLEQNWQKKLEGLLQDLGKSVASASKVASSAGVPGFARQAKRETIHDLKEAGIDVKAALSKRY